MTKYTVHGESEKTDALSNSISREFHYGSLNSHGSVVLSCFRFCLVSDKSCTDRTIMNFNFHRE